MRRFLQVTLALFAASMILLALSRGHDANASSAYSSPYTYEQTYGTMLRLLRVDLGHKIVERDKELGYILFEYTSPESGNRVSSGSVELVDTKNGVQVGVQLPQMPRYHEQMIVDQLAKKLQDEHGTPPAKKPEPPPAGKDGDKDKDKAKEGDGSKDEEKPKDGAPAQP